MIAVFEGDEWKHEKPPPRNPSPPSAMCREAQQRQINLAYAYGRLSLEEWRLRTDALSEPQRS